MEGSGPDGPRLAISEAARMAGVSASTVRIWEASELVRAERDGRYRRFPPAEIGRLRTIASLRARGFSLAAIREYLKDGSSTRQDGQYRSAVPHMGARLRQIRRSRGITLKQAAASSQLSISHISAVERGLGNISMTALQRLANALGVHVSDLFGPNRSGPHRLVRAGHGPRLVLSEGRVEMQLLSVDASLLQSHLFVLEPGGESDGAYQHEGEEMVYVIAGEVEFWLNESERYLVREGDCLTFPSTMQHRFRNTLPQRAVMVWVNTPISF